MKILQVILLCILLMLQSVSCGHAPKEDSSDSALLSEYLQTLELPENFSIQFDPDSVEQLSSAKLYQADFLQFDEDTVKQEFLKYDIKAEHSYAEGPQWETEKEYLTLYDGGASFFGREQDDSGINYQLLINGIKSPSLYAKLSNIVMLAPDPVELNAVKPFDDKRHFSSFTDLPFMPYAQAYDDVSALLARTGFPDLEVVEAYSLDLDTLQRHHSLYIDYYNDIDSDLAMDEQARTYSEEDEAYLFFFRQMIDSIPLANMNWQTITFDTVPTETTIFVLYTRDGIRDTFSHNLYSPGEGAEHRLISSTRACQVLVDTYSQSIIDEDTSVESMELNYVATLTNSGFELIPSWIFRIVTSTQVDGKAYYPNSYFVLNACTGERIVKAR